MIVAMALLVPAHSYGDTLGSDKPLPPAIQTLVSNMVYVQGGSFTMGATDNQKSDAESDEKPAHTVVLTSYKIGKYEVTQEEWCAVMERNPAEFKGAHMPVENVSWNDCQVFLRKLNDMSGMAFRLPTEAEWEFAARGGKQSRNYKYAGSNNVDSVAWHRGNSGNKPHEVGQKMPNELGLYDMSGNVYEFCNDWKGKYTAEDQQNPQGPQEGTNRVNRGGRWCGGKGACRVSDRSMCKPDDRFYHLGLRLALSVEEDTETEPIPTNKD